MPTEAHLQLLVDGSKAAASVRTLEQALNRLADRADKAQGSLDRLGSKAIRVRVSADGIDRVQSSVKALQAQLAAIKPISVKATGAGLSGVRSDLTALQRQIAAINATKVAPQSGPAPRSPSTSGPSSAAPGAAATSLDNLTVKARATQAALDQLGSKSILVKVNSVQIDRALKRVQALQEQMGRIKPLDLSASNADFSAARRDLAAIQKQIDRINSSRIQPQPGASTFQQGATSRLGGGMPKPPDFTSLTRGVTGLAENFKRLEGSILSVQGVLTGLGVGAAVKDIAQTGMAFQSLESGLAMATNSAIGGREEFKRLKAETDRLGLSTLDTGKAYVNFVASVSGSNVNVEKAKDTFFGVAQAMALLGKSPADADRAFNALSQMASKGKITAEELTGQLAEQLPGAFALTAKALGMSTEELSKAMEKGQVSIQSFFNVFNDAVRNKFPADRIDSASASFGRFRNAMDEAKRTIADGGFLKAAADGAEEFARFLNSVDGKRLANELGGVLKDAVDTLIQGFRLLVDNVETVKTVIQALIGIKIASWILGVVTNVVALAGAFKVLGIAIASNPLISIAVTLAGATTALIAMNNQIQNGTAAWAEHSGKMETIKSLHAQLATAHGDERKAIKDKIVALQDEAKQAVISIQEQIDKRRELMALEQQMNQGGPGSVFGAMQDQTASYGLAEGQDLPVRLENAKATVAATTNVLEGKTPEGTRKRGSPAAGTSKGAQTVQPAKTTSPASGGSGENIGQKYADQKRELRETIKSQTEMAAAYGIGTDAVEAQARKMDILNQVQSLNPKYSKAQVRELENLIGTLYDAEKATKFNEAVSGMDEARSQTIALTDATMALAHGTEGSAAAMVNEQAQIQARNAAIALGVTHDQERVASLEKLFAAEARANQEADNAKAIKIIQDEINATDRQTEALGLQGEKRAVVLATLEEEARLTSENIDLTSRLAQERLKAAGDAVLSKNRNAQKADVEDMMSQLSGLSQYQDALGLTGEALIRKNAEIEKSIEMERQGLSATSEYGAQQIALAGQIAVTNEALSRQNDSLMQLANSGMTFNEQMRSISYDGLMSMEDALVDIITGTKSVKEAFADMAKAIAADLARMAIRQAITIPLAMGLSSMFMGGGAAGMATGMPMMLRHKGGTGSDAGSMRHTDPSLFIDAPRFHNGKMPALAAGEMPAIIKRDEGVFTPAQMASLAPAGSGGAVVNFSPVIQVTQPQGATEEQGQRFGKGIVREMQAMVDERISHAFKPGGIRNQSGY